MSLGTVKIPTLAQLGEVAAELGLSFSEADLAAHLEALRPSFEGYNLLDQMPDELPPVAYPRRPGRRPAPEENPLGLVYQNRGARRRFGQACRKNGRAEGQYLPRGRAN